MTDIRTRSSLLNATFIFSTAVRIHFLPRRCLLMTYPEFVAYLRATSEHCRTCADTATDAEAAVALREVAGELESAAFAFEGAEKFDKARELLNS